MKSGVIRLQRRDADPACNEHLLRKLVKITFNQRRKMIRNTIKILLGGIQSQHPLYTKRPEQLSVQDFIDLTNFLESHTK